MATHRPYATVGLSNGRTLYRRFLCFALDVFSVMRFGPEWGVALRSPSARRFFAIEVRMRISVCMRSDFLSRSALRAVRYFPRCSAIWPMGTSPSTLSTGTIRLFARAPRVFFEVREFLRLLVTLPRFAQRAAFLEIGRPVAKLLVARHLGRRERVERFREPARIVAAYQHPPAAARQFVYVLAVVSGFGRRSVHGLSVSKKGPWRRHEQKSCSRILQESNGLRC